MLNVGKDCELLVLDPKTEHLEGEASGHQTVVLRFASKEKAREVYRSKGYQAVIGKRLAATSRHFAVLVEGLGG